MHVPNQNSGPSSTMRGLFAACLIGLLPLTARASEIEEDHALSMDFVTPHTRWAKPYARGKTRVLVFINGRGTLPREIIELKQRFDLDAASVYWIRVIDHGNYKWLHGEAGIERMRKLLDQPWDCYVMYQLPLALLPVDAQYKLLKAVTLGKGLVMVGQDDKRVLKEKNRLPELPVFLADGTPLQGLSFATTPGKVMTAYHVKEGRALRTCARPNLGHDVGWDTEYEYWVQLLGRAILWTAGKEPEMALQVRVNEPTCDRDRLRDTRALIEWRASGQSPARPVQVDVSLRRFDGRTTLLNSLKATSALGAVEQGVGVSSNGPINLRAGRYFVDTMVRGPQGVEAWGSTTFEVTSNRAVEKIELDSPYSEIGGRLSGKVTLAGETRPSESVRVDLLDPRGRVIARTDLPIRPGAMAFQFDVEPWMPMLIRVVARLMHEGQEVAHTYTWFHVTKRHRGRFNHLIWDYPRGTLAPWCERALATYGMTLQLCGGNPPNYVAANGLAWVPYTIHIRNTLDANGIMNKGCWNDPKVIDQRMAKLVKEYTPARQHGVFVYSLGDEIATRGSCLSPHCLTAYRKYLQEQYGPIEALNASWDSTYKAFDEIELLDPEDNDSAEAKRRGIYSRWFDRQAFQSHNICRYYKQFGDTYRKIDPESRTGYEGAGRFARGDDYDLIVRTNQFWSPYPGLGDEVIRSIAPRDFPRSNWMGYVKTADPLIWKYWRMVTRGCDAVWWWRWEALGRFHGFLAPSLVPFDATKEMIKDTQIVRRGLGTLLIKSERLDDGVAILFSHPSSYSTKVEAGPSYGSYAAMHELWCRTLRELRLEFRYVTDRMLRLGEFNPDSAKVLVLPHAEALGPQEAAAVERFVRAGGTVIADVRAGIYTRHCKPRVASPLDGLFGIKRDKPAVAHRATVKVGGRFGELTLENMACDPSVQLAGGEALGTGAAPAVIVSKVGRGQAVLLNFSLAGYPALWTKTAPEPPARFLSALFASAGVEPVFSVVDEAGHRVRDLEVTRWQNRGIQIVSFFRKGGEEQRGSVQMPGAFHAYDLRTKKRLTPARSIPISILPNRPTWVALAPSPLPPVRLRLSADRGARGDTLTLTATAPGAAGLHAVYVEVSTPSGDKAEWLGGELMVDGRGTPCALPIAFTDPLGKWTVTATDLYTGKTTTATYTVK